MIGTLPNLKNGNHIHGYSSSDESGKVNLFLLTLARVTEEEIQSEINSTEWDNEQPKNRHAVVALKVTLAIGHSNTSLFSPLLF